MKLRTLLVLLAVFALSCSEDTGSDASAVEDDVGGDADPMDVLADMDDVAPEVEGDSPETCTSNADCDDGIFCNGTERCFNGECFDSRSPQCEDHIPCTADECDEEERFCNFVPLEELCEEGQVCDLKAGCFTPAECTRNEDCDDGLVCNGEEVCGRDGMCAPGTPLNCDDGVACTDDECVEEVGACQNVPNHTLCLPTELCNIQEGCEEQPPCTNDDDCNDASFCNGEETCNVETGECVPGEAPAVDDGVPCTIDSCSDQLGQVVHTPHAARCSDGLFCNGAEICHPVDGCQAGEPPVLSDGVGCTTDRCDEEADFVEHIADSGACDDGLFCNGEEVCHPVDGCQPGEPPVVNDGVGCTVDTCSEVERAVLNVPSSELCDDGLFCNGAEVCDVVEGCQAGEAPAVDDGIECTQDRCDEETDTVVHAPQNGACDNGAWCDGEEVCNPEVGCEAGPAPTLSDGVDCTLDTCDEENDRVVHTAQNARCDDGAFCNGEEVCDPREDCQDGVPPTVNDGVGCTDDRCDEANDRIIHVPNHGLCDDGLFCNGAETCDVEDGCQEGERPVVNDDIPCTIDRCDEQQDEVTHTPNHQACQDQLWCNGTEICSVDVGCIDGEAPQVDDGVPCTDDRCDEDRNEVVNTPVHARCDDDLFCDGEEVCDPRLGCREGTPPVVSDGVGCTADSCDEANDRILHVPQHDLCNDGAFCNGEETCHPVNDCVDGTPPVLNDGVGCTDDRCDEANDRVIHAPNDGLCDDQLFCNGVETCDAVNDCQSGTPPTLSDGINCTIDRCDEQRDRITHTPNHQSCQNNLWCDGAEVCDLQDGCVAGAPRDLDDGVGCTDDSCDEVNDRVVHMVNHDNCDDDLWCNGAETCHAQNDCQDGTPPMEEDEVDCTEAVCDEDNDEIVQTPRHERCDDGLVCNGAESCRREFGCLPGIDADDGTVCQDNPRRVCMDGECVDDGGFDWTDRFDVEPDISYQCAESIFLPGFYGVEYSFTHLDFRDDGGVVLQVTPSPNGPNTIFTMEQRPTPPGPGFSVTTTLAGLSCIEVYTLTGIFTTDDEWSGTFTREYINPGPPFGDCRDCTNLSIPVTGTRQ